MDFKEREGADLSSLQYAGMESTCEEDSLPHRQRFLNQRCGLLNVTQRSIDTTYRELNTHRINTTHAGLI